MIQRKKKTYLAIKLYQEFAEIFLPWAKISHEDNDLFCGFKKNAKTSQFIGSLKIENK